MQPPIETQFERNFGQLGPHHHPVFVNLPNGMQKGLVLIQCTRLIEMPFDIPTSCKLQSWTRFEAEFHDLLKLHPLTTGISP